MRSKLFRSPLAALLAFAMSATSAGWNSPLLAEETCGDYGTAVVFLDSPADAARQALREQKLVFVLHVSGNFEESEYT